MANAPTIKKMHLMEDIMDDKRIVLNSEILALAFLTFKCDEGSSARPKTIIVTPSFYNYLSALQRENVYLLNNEQPIAYFMGVPVVTDNTIEGYYKLEY